MRLKLAKGIRVLTAPPFMAAGLLCVLMAAKPAVFPGWGSFFWMLIFLALLPVTAYPLAAAIPALRKTGRQGQRKTAFVLTLISYPGALVYGLFSHAGRVLPLIGWTYFFSALLLAVLNKATPFHASGHVCALAGPLILLLDLLGLPVLLPALLIGGAVVWSSLSLGRHTKKELLFGALAAAAAFLLSLLLA